VLIAVDIDGTIACDPGARNHAYFMNKALNLGISYQTISTLDSIEQFMSLPEVRMWKEQEGSSIERFKAAWDKAQYDIELQRHATPTSGAVVGVQELTKQGTIIYVTCRKDESRATTQEWLARHGFLTLNACTSVRTIRISSSEHLSNHNPMSMSS